MRVLCVFAYINVFMIACVCVCLCACVCMFVFICECAYVSVCVCLHVCAYVSLFVCLRMPIWTPLCIHKGVYVCKPPCAYVPVYVRVCKQAGWAIDSSAGSTPTASITNCPRPFSPHQPPLPRLSSSISKEYSPSPDQQCSMDLPVSIFSPLTPS